MHWLEWHKYVGYDSKTAWFTETTTTQNRAMLDVPCQCVDQFKYLGLAQKPNVVWGIHHSLASPKDESISTKIALGLSKILSQQASAIIYCAHSSMQQHQAFGFKNANSQVIANGVFLDKFQPNPQLHEPTVIGFAGRYHTPKAIPICLKPWAC
jgi:glycosyltransferase involved in cell wall biosynthesis